MNIVKSFFTDMFSKRQLFLRLMRKLQKKNKLEYYRCQQHIFLLATFRRLDDDYLKATVFCPYKSDEKNCQKLSRFAWQSPASNFAFATSLCLVML